MKHPVRPIAMLESRHLMSIILFIHENGPSRRTDIYENISKNANIPNKILALIDNGILTEERCRHRMLLSLTDRGRELAESLNTIESVLMCDTSQRKTPATTATQPDDLFRHMEAFILGCLDERKAGMGYIDLYWSLESAGYNADPLDDCLSSLLGDGRIYEYPEGNYKLTK